MNYDYSRRVSGMKPSIIRELFKQMADPALIAFAGGNPAPEAFPLEAIGAISEKLLRTDPIGVLQYSVTDGLPALREAGEAFINRDFPVKKPEDGILVTSGSQQGIEFATKLLCNEGDVVVVEEPTFLGSLNTFRGYGVQLYGVPIQPDGVDTALLEKAFAAQPKPKFFYTIPNFQNPTGYTTSLAKRREIYRLAQQYDVLILEDDPYGALRFAGQALPPIKSFDTEGRVIYALSLSKIMAPGMRVGFIAAPAEIVAKMVVAKQGSDVHTTVWSQRVCDAFLREYDVQAHLARLREIYFARAEKMMKRLNEKLGDAVSYVPPEGGMFLWMALPENIDMQGYVRRCLEKKLALVPGNAFYTDDAAPSGSVRLNFSSPRIEQIEPGVDIMAQALREMLAEA